MQQKSVVPPNPISTKDEASCAFPQSINRFNMHNQDLTIDILQFLNPKPIIIKQVPMDSHQDDHLSSIRRRNKTLIITFFSLIFLLALITGGIIITFVQKLNVDAAKSNRAIQQFCTTFGDYRSDSCVTLLSSQIKAPTHTNPNHIFMLSIEISLEKITKIVSILPESGNCSSSLSHAAGQLSKILDIIRVDPDVETYQRENLTAWIDAAEKDLTACVRDPATAERTAAMVDEVREVVIYSGDFLRHCEIVNDNFRHGVYIGERDSWDEIVENLITVSLFGSQYFVLLFLFCLLLRIYYCKK